VFSGIYLIQITSEDLLGASHIPEDYHLPHPTTPTTNHTRLREDKKPDLITKNKAAFTASNLVAQRALKGYENTKHSNQRTDNSPR
jgi:hypothetical protein